MHAKRGNYLSARQDWAKHADLDPSGAVGTRERKNLSVLKIWIVDRRESKLAKKGG